MKKKNILVYVLILIIIFLLYCHFSSTNNIEIKDYVDEVEHNKNLT